MTLKPLYPQALYNIPKPQKVRFCKAINIKPMLNITLNINYQTLPYGCVTLLLAHYWCTV